MRDSDSDDGGKRKGGLCIPYPIHGNDQCTMQRIVAKLIVQ
jgi:hypothetical protein